MLKLKRLLTLLTLIGLFFFAKTSTAEILFQDNFDNWPQVNGGDWYCCNAINSSCPTDQRNAAPAPWGVNYGHCGTANNGGGYANNTMKIVAGRSGKALGICRKGGVGIDQGYMSYLAPPFDTYPTRKLYVRKYMKWPAALDKVLTNPFAWKMDYFGFMRTPSLALLMGFGNYPYTTIQTGTVGFGINSGNLNTFLPWSTFNNDYVYLEYMIDVDAGTMKMWYGDIYNREDKPFWTRTGLDFQAPLDDYLSNHYWIGFGNSTDSDWTNSEWACAGIDDLVVSTTWVGPVPGSPSYPIPTPVVVNDNFNRAENPISNGWTNIKNVIQTDAIVAKGTMSGDNIAIWTGNSFIADQYAQAVVNSAYTGVIVRGRQNGSSWDGYLARAYNDQFIELYRYNAGVATNLNTFFSQGSAYGSTLKITAEHTDGNTLIRVYQNGILLGTNDELARPSDALNYGSPGIFTNLTGTVDDFEGGEIIPGATYGSDTTPPAPPGGVRVQ